MFCFRECARVRVRVFTKAAVSFHNKCQDGRAQGYVFMPYSRALMNACKIKYNFQQFCNQIIYIYIYPRSLTFSLSLFLCPSVCQSVCLSLSLSHTHIRTHFYCIYSLNCFEFKASDKYRWLSGIGRELCPNVEKLRSIILHLSVCKQNICILFYFLFNIDQLSVCQRNVQDADVSSRCYAAKQVRRHFERSLRFSADMSGQGSWEANNTVVHLGKILQCFCQVPSNASRLNKWMNLFLNTVHNRFSDI